MRDALSLSRSIELAQHAHRHRIAPTRSEERMWTALSGRKLGVQFRRQVVLAERYIVDFYAPRVRLVVEVDGDSHRRRQHADAQRDRKLRRLGYRVLRISADLVMRDLDAAVAKVRDARICRARSAMSVE